MRWLVLSVLVASAAHAGERGFQFRAVVDTGAAVLLQQTNCSESCAPGFNTFELGPLASVQATAGARFGRFSFHGGAELQWLWFFSGHSLRAGPLLGISFHLERWAVLSLDTKLLFSLFGPPSGALGGVLRWGFELSPGGTHQLAASAGVYMTSGMMITTSVAYVLTL